MKVRVDFSVFSSPDKAFGNVAGEMDLPALPGTGDYLTFSDVELMLISPEYFSGLLAVESRRFEVDTDECSLMLQDVVMANEAEAEKLVAGFERAYGFKGYQY